MIEIKQASTQYTGDMGRCDGTFLVTSELILRFENGLLSYSVLEVPPYEKKYSSALRNNVEPHEQRGITFLAYENGELAGQVDVSRHWNNFACINNIIVDHRFRRSGVGKRLVHQAIEWSVEESLAGLMLETQTNNVPACKLYESCGLTLKGFDGSLYAGLDCRNSETALFWYWIRPVGV